jgi:hypothetical protein
MAALDPCASNDALKAYLAEEIGLDIEDGVESQVALILLDFVKAHPQPDHQAVARELARRINADYWELYRQSVPLLKRQEDKGLAGYLNGLYELIFGLARLIGYDDSQQDVLVEVLVELHKLPLPDTTFKIYGVGRCWPSIHDSNKLLNKNLERLLHLRREPGLRPFCGR